MRHFDVRLSLRGPDALLAPRAAGASLAHALAPFSAVVEAEDRSMRVQLHIVAASSSLAEDRARGVIRAAIDLLVPQAQAWRMHTVGVHRWRR